MFSNKNQTSNDQKQLLFLIGMTMSLLLAGLFAVIVTGRAGTNTLDNLVRIGETVVHDIPAPLQAFLKDQAQAMSMPIVQGSQAFWFLARAGGIVSYLLLWLATCWGMIMSSKVLKGYLNSAWAFSLHEFLPILGIVFAALHALVILGDTYINFNIWQLLIPFTSTYEPFWTGLGSLAFYMFLALIISFYVRPKIGQKSWRAFHYTSYLAFLLAALHGLMAGSDSGTVLMRALYLATGSVTLFLIYYRLLTAAPRTTQKRQRPGS